MDELPEGLSIPPLEARAYIPSASVMLSREADDGHEVLMGHRSSELPAFPDLWSFPGGGVSRVDKEGCRKTTRMAFGNGRRQDLSIHPP